MIQSRDPRYCHPTL